MSSPYAAGSVWWCYVDFNDGEGERKKYFVFLSDCADNGEQAALAFTTSRGYRYHGQGESPCGCPANPCFRIEPGEEACFRDATTFVQFDNTWLMVRPKIAMLESAGKAGFLQHLSEQRLRSILNCAKKSLDTPGRVLQLVDRTIKSLKPSRQTPPKGQPTVAVPSFVSAEILSVRVRVQKRCGTCRDQLAGAMGVAEVEITRILAGGDAPASFLADIGAGLDAIDCLCTKE